MSRTRLLALTGLLVLWGCGGGDATDTPSDPEPAPSPPPADTLAPFGRFTFPPLRSLTDRDRLTVTGIAGDTGSGVDSVRVSGVPAVSEDGFATWRAVVPLSVGSNTLELEVRDRADNRRVAGTVVVERDPPIWAAPSAFVVTGGEALVADGTLRTVFRVELASGAREILPLSGSPLVAPAGAALDAVGGRMLLTDAVQGAVLAIDAATGASSFLSLGLPLATPQGIALDAARARALVADLLADEVIAVDLATGDAATWATGFDDPRGIAVDPVAGAAYVSDRGGLHRVDLDDGTVATVTDTLADAGAIVLRGGQAWVVEGTSLVSVDLSTGTVAALADGFAFPRGLAVDGARLLVTDSGLDGIYGVDIATGTRTTLSRAGFGGGVPLAFPRGLAVDLVNERAFAVDFSIGVLRIDLATGDRVVLSGSGPALVTPLAADFDSRDNRVLVADTGLAALVGIDAVTGDRVILSDAATGEGGLLITPRDVAFDPLTRLAFVVDTSLAALIAIDVANGNRALVSGLGRGPGIAFLTPRALAFDAPAARLLVADTGNGAVYEVDVATGARVPGFASGSAVSNTTGLVLDRGRERLLLTDTVLDGIVAADPDTGTASVRGSGPALPSPEAICLDPSADRLFVVDSAMGALMAVEPGSRDRVIISK